MKWLRRSLTNKFILLLLGFLLLQTIQLGSGIFGVLHIGEVSAVINEAGKQRIRLFWMQHVVRMAEDLKLNVANRKRLTALIEEQDAVFVLLHRHTENLSHGYLKKDIAVSQAHWENNVRPLLVALRVSDAAGARAASARLVTLIPQQLALADRVVGNFQQNATDDARDLAWFQGIMLGFTLLLGIVGLVMARRIVTLPLRELTRGTRAIATGVYNQCMVVRSRDELGELGNAFNQMAGAINEKTSRLDAFSQVAVAITSSLSQEQILQDIMRRGALLTGSKAACIAFYDQQTKCFKEWVTYGLSDRFVQNMAFRPGGLADEAFTTTTTTTIAAGIYILSNDWPETRHKLSKLTRNEGIRAFICLPLTSHTNRLGVIYFYRTDRDSFMADEIELLQTFSSLAAGAIENARLYRRAEDQARTDVLTGLYNRREFDERLDAEFRRAQRYSKPFAFLFLDIDNFKQVNDTYGHDAGDAVLKALAEVLIKQFRDVDILARYGGEEFVVMLPEIDGGTAKGVAERVRRAVAATPFRLPDSGEIAVTVSIGVSCYPACASTPEGVVSRADQALYIAKQAGRNRVVLYRETLKARIEKDPDLVVELLTESMDNVLPIVTAVSCKAPFFRNHVDTVERTAMTLAQTLGLSPEERETLRLASLLHDIGMITVPDTILAKTDLLSPEEWELVKHHPVTAAELLERVPALRHVASLVRHHHERMDGQGYPDGLKGDELPYLARILAVADAYTAMIADWPGRKPITNTEAKAKLQAGAGTQFDPKIVQALLESFEAL